MGYKTYTVVGLIWNTIILIVFSYLIFFKDASPWWYLFMILIANFRRTRLEWGGC